MTLQDGRMAGWQDCKWRNWISQSCNPAILQSCNSQEKPRNRRRHEVRQRPREHRAEAEPRQVVPSIGRQRADAADLDADRAEIREAAQRKRRDRERLRVERSLERAEL